MIQVKSRPQRFQCQLEDGTIIDTTCDKGGSGEGIRPHDLLEAALAACMNISLRMCAEKEGIALDKVETAVRLNRDAEGKTIFEYSYRIGDDLDEPLRSKIISILDCCPVRKTLSKQIEFQERFSLPDAPD